MAAPPVVALVRRVSSINDVRRKCHQRVSDRTRHRALQFLCRLLIRTLATLFLEGRRGLTSTTRSASRHNNHGFEPGLFEPKSPLPGNEIFRAETGGLTPRKSFKELLQRQKRRSKPANSEPIVANREISVRTRTQGGGRSQSRTSLSNKFPGNRGMKQGIRQIRRSAAMQASKSTARSIACRVIPYTTEQGSSTGHQRRFPNEKRNCRERARTPKSCMDPLPS